MKNPQDDLKNMVLQNQAYPFISRREFVEWMGGLSAVLGLGACTRMPEERIYPYAKAPESVVPGKSQFYATAMPTLGGAIGLLVESHMGRPTKIEGNPDHPASLGATSAVAQASILDLYDPDRARSITFRGRIQTWEGVQGTLAALRESLRRTDGEKLRVLFAPNTSPTFQRILKELFDKYPRAKAYSFEPTGALNQEEGTVQAFGEAHNFYYRVDGARTILALESDFLCEGPTHVRNAREFSKARQPTGTMVRLFAAESFPTNTGAMADHRLPLRPTEIEGVVLALAAELGLGNPMPRGLRDSQKGWIARVARELQATKGASFVTVGPRVQPAIQAVVHAINESLGANGRHVIFTAALEYSGKNLRRTFPELVKEMQLGQVEALLMLGVNPIYSAPLSGFAEALKKVAQTFVVSSHLDETAVLADWHIPQSHYLESWADVRCYDGSVSIVQPLIAPLYSSKTFEEVMSLFVSSLGGSDYDNVRQTWMAAAHLSEVEWRKAIHDGLVAKSSLPERRPKARPVSTFLSQIRPVAADAARKLELRLLPDPTVGDGSRGNNGWLQELPKPVTKVTWDNVLHMGPGTAVRFGLEARDMVELKSGSRHVSVPIWIVPGMAEDALVLHYGYGRTHGGRLASGSGVNGYLFAGADGGEILRGVEVVPLGYKGQVACTQDHARMEGRELVRKVSVQQLLQGHLHTNGSAHHTPTQDYLQGETLLGKREGLPFVDPDYAWAMVIDLNNCTGCNACVIACQSENNVPVVGKEEVARGREMHWLRIDRYYEGDGENPETHFQPVPCMHCENAPCEVVCPVAATSHSPEGINEMTYNRCVGTKYCSNNCPYKVRRFNFFRYADMETPQLKMQRNPNVTVRSRGVMEKCTYCVQRVNAARIEARNQNRTIREGEVVTACQAACPSQAIVFGNQMDANSRVAQLKKDPRNYALLEELNTRPRTTYMAKVGNPAEGIPGEKGRG